MLCTVSTLESELYFKLIRRTQNVAKPSSQNWLWQPFPLTHMETNNIFFQLLSAYICPICIQPQKSWQFGVSLLENKCGTWLRMCSVHPGWGVFWRGRGRRGPCGRGNLRCGSYAGSLGGLGMVEVLDGPQERHLLMLFKKRKLIRRRPQGPLPACWDRWSSRNKETQNEKITWHLKF